MEFLVDSVVWTKRRRNNLLAAESDVSISGHRARFYVEHRKAGDKIKQYLNLISDCCSADPEYGDYNYWDGKGAPPVKPFCDTCGGVFRSNGKPVESGGMVVFLFDEVYNPTDRYEVSIDLFLGVVGTYTNEYELLLERNEFVTYCEELWKRFDKERSNPQTAVVR